MELFLSTFIFLAFVGAVYDFLFYKIPNVIVGGILVLYFTMHLTYWGIGDIWYPMMIFFVNIFVGFGLYALRLMGAGDVKFFAACAMWASQNDLLTFFVTIGLCGGMLAFLYLMAHGHIQLIRGGILNFFINRLGPDGFFRIFGDIKQPQKQEKRFSFTGIMLPYGVAIFFGCLLAVYLPGIR